MLILMIVLQLLSAIAETSDTHQVDVQHLQTEHSHADDISLENDNSATENHDIQDCHHCGHCSGAHLTWIIAKETSGRIDRKFSDSTPYQNFTEKEFIEATLRPPIA